MIDDPGGQLCCLGRGQDVGVIDPVDDAFHRGVALPVGQGGGTIILHGKTLVDRLAGQQIGDG
ncbi:hypothetical protein D3C79_876420 [compost metagenome]